MANEKLVMFSFQNMYLIGIHAGIQSGHCWMDMAVKFFPPYDKTGDGEIFWDWSRNHRTSSIKCGGDQDQLVEIEELFNFISNPYPWCSWNESHGSLNGALTNVSIILPEHIYGHLSKRGKKQREPLDIQPEFNSPEMDSFERKLFTLLTRCKNMT